MIKIVIDANVWVRFARYRNLTLLLDRIGIYSILPVANRYLLSEVFDALISEGWMTEKLAFSTVSIVEAVCVLTAENVVFRIDPDPKDNYLFDLAIQLNCPFIIGDDTALLSFVMQPVKVRSCNWFLKNFPV